MKSEALVFSGNERVFLNSFDKLRIALNLKLLSFELCSTSLYIRKSSGASLFFKLSNAYSLCLQSLLDIVSLPAVVTTSYKFSFGYGFIYYYPDFYSHLSYLSRTSYYKNLIWSLDVEVFFPFNEISKYWLLKNFPLPVSLLKRFLYLNKSIILLSNKASFLFSNILYFSFYNYILNGLV